VQLANSSLIMLCCMDNQDGASQASGLREMRRCDHRELNLKD
jgi:hypothetical protein